MTQLTTDRMWMLVQLARRWGGAVSAAVLQPVGALAGSTLPADLRERVTQLNFRQITLTLTLPLTLTLSLTLSLTLTLSLSLTPTR